MKSKTLPILLLLAVLSWSCTDQCKETRTYRRLIPITLSMAELRSAVHTEAPRALKKPGKMYIRGNYIFINEIKEGIHIIDNSNPTNPKFVAFVNIPGSGDIAVKDNILYADSYSDLVALDINNIESPKEVGRVQNVFMNGQFDGAWWSFAGQNAGIFDNAINDYKVEWVTETINTSCEDNYPNVYYDASFSSATAGSGFVKSSAASPNPGNPNGKAGSMSRFALQGDFLYAVTQSDLRLFNVSTPKIPMEAGVVNVGWNIETIFPYRNRLFIGSSTGMFIYDASRPQSPALLSVFQHGRACDPVVVHDDLAYVTLRTGNACAGTQNQLDVVDVSNPASPELLKSYQMQNPHGLSIDFPTLYLCEGEHGLKVFDATDKNAIDQKLLAHFKEMDAFDVIAMDKSIMVIGKDGFYQYDASDVRNLRLLSKITVQK